MTGTLNTSKADPSPSKGEKVESTGFFTLDTSQGFSYSKKSPTADATSSSSKGIEKVPSSEMINRQALLKTESSSSQSLVTTVNTINIPAKDNTEVSPLNSKPPIPKSMRKTQSTGSMNSTNSSIAPAAPPIAVRDSGSLGSVPSQQDLTQSQSHQEGENQAGQGVLSQESRQPSMVKLPLHQTRDEAQSQSQNQSSPPQDVQQQQSSQALQGSQQQPQQQQQPPVQPAPPPQEIRRQQSVQSLQGSQQEQTQTQPATTHQQQLQPVSSQQEINQSQQQQQQQQTQQDQSISLPTEIPVQQQQQQQTQQTVYYQIPGVVTLPVQPQTTNANQTQMTEIPVNSSQQNISQSQIQVAQQPQQEQIIGMMGAIPIIKIQGGAQQHFVVKKKGRFKLLQETPPPGNSNTTNNTAATPSGTAATTATPHNIVVTQGPSSAVPAVSQIPNTAVPVPETFDGSSTPTVKKKGRFVVTNVKDPGSIPNIQSQQSLAPPADTTVPVQQPLAQQRSQIVQPQVLFQPNQSVIQTHNVQPVQAVQPLVLQGTAPVSVSVSAPNNALHHQQQQQQHQQLSNQHQVPQGQPQHVIVQERTEAVPALHSLSATIQVSSTDASQKAQTTMAPPNPVNVRSSTIAGSNAETLRHNTQVPANTILSKATQSTEKSHVSNGTGKKKVQRKPPPIDRNDTWNSVGLGKLSYLLDQMKTEVTDADQMIKTLQTDLKLLRTKNKELEAKNKDLEKSLKEEKILREKSEARNVELRKKLRGAKTEANSQKASGQTTESGPGLTAKTTNPPLSETTATMKKESSSEVLVAIGGSRPVTGTLAAGATSSSTANLSQSTSSTSLAAKGMEANVETPKDEPAMDSIALSSHTRSNSNGLETESGSLNHPINSTPLKRNATVGAELGKSGATGSSIMTHTRSNSCVENESGFLNATINSAPLKGNSTTATAVQLRRKDTMASSTATHSRSNSNGFESDNGFLNTVVNATPTKGNPTPATQPGRNDVMAPTPVTVTGQNGTPLPSKAHFVSEFDPLRPTHAVESPNISGGMVPVISFPTQLSLEAVPINATSTIFQNPANSAELDQGTFVSENPFVLPVTLGMAPAVDQSTGNGFQQMPNSFQQQSFMVVPQQQPIMFQQVSGTSVDQLTNTIAGQILQPIPSQQSSFPQNSMNGTNLQMQGQQQQQQQQVQHHSYFNAAESFDPLVARRQIQ